MSLPDDARPVPEWDGYYVTPSGEMWSMKRTEPRLLRPRRDHRGYLTVSCRAPGRKTLNGRIHVFVALVFVGPRPAGFEINHRNGDKANNSVSNLEYITPRENKEHALRNGLGCPRKLTDEDTCTAYFMRESGGYHWDGLAECFGVTRRTLERHMKAAGFKTSVRRAVNAAKLRALIEGAAATKEGS